MAKLRVSKAKSRRGEVFAADARLFAVVLAAGTGSRFGSTKQLAAFHDAPLVSRAVRLAEKVCGPASMLVAGHEWRAVVEACRPLEGFFVYNAEHRSGMGGSIACGVRAVMGAADAVLLLLADQPLITTEHLEHLIAAWKLSPETILATSFAGTAGPPVIFPRQYFDELSRLQGDRGARSILSGAGRQVQHVRFEDAAADIDRLEDLRRLT